MRSVVALLVMSACADGKDDPKPDDTIPAPCEAPEPPAEAIVKAGLYDGIVVLPDGRTLTPAGLHIELGGFPADVAIATTEAGTAVGLVTNAARSSRSIEVVRLSDGALLSSTTRTDAFPGIAVDGQTVYASGGNSDAVDVYRLRDDGVLEAGASFAVGRYPTGLQLSADRATLYVALFLGTAVVAVDVTTGVVTDSWDTGFNAYRIALSPDGSQVWATGFADTQLAVVDIASGQVDTVEVGGNPAGIVVTPDGTVLVAVSNEDVIVAIDSTTQAEIGRVSLKEAAIVGEDGPLPGTSPSDLTLSDDSQTLYVTRAADNAVGVIDVASLTLVGNIPTGWYPTGVAVEGDTLFVSNGKGIGAGPNGDGTFVSDAMIGTVGIVTLADSELPAWTAAVADNLARPANLYPFGDCAGTFPIPRKPGDPTPIEHVILIVRENKTYDSLLGDLDVPGADRDESLTQWPEYNTPNLHALARRFANHDNFYDNSESSVQGHLWLTSSFVSEYMERAWIEDYHGVSVFADDAATEVGRPEFGTIFTHLLGHGIEIRNYGEIVGALDIVNGVSVVEYTDLSYPGVFFTTDVPDEDRARYAAQKLFTEGDFPPFVYMLLPNDHGGGPYPDTAMMADNDYATGLFIDALSKSEYWEKTVVFLVEDDPQSAVDHVDAHRSIFLVMSPWAKRRHTSHVMASYPSVFKTIEQILGVPPMNRFDANATPLYDAFTSTPDTTPYDALPRNVDNAGNPAGPTAPPETPPADPEAVRLAGLARKCLDLSGPDRNPFLLDIHYAERFGRLPVDSILWRTTDCRKLHGGGEEEDGDGDEDAYDDAWEAFEEWQRANPGRADHVVRPARPAHLRDDDD